MALTQKQEAFCLAYIETGNASEAYRRAYDAEKMKPETVTKRASELLSNGEVTGRVEQLQKMAVTRHAITVDDLIAELEEARTLASGGEKPKPAAMVSATMGKAKLLGFDVQKIDATVTSKEGVLVIGATMTPEDWATAAKEQQAALTQDNV